MTNTSTLTVCPACGATLTEAQTSGDYRTFTCPNHRTFSISGTAIQMAHNLPQYMTNLGQRIEQARNSESNERIMSDHIQ